MASIVQRNKSFSVVYTIYDGDKKKQKWETYHSYEAALKRKEQLDLVQQHEKERAQYREGTLAQFLEEYVELYGRIHWACSTYTSNGGLIRNYIVPFMGSMRLTEFSPKVIAALYGKLQSDPKITPSVLTNIHKLLHSAFEQAVLWEHIPRNPFQKANVPKVFPSEIPILTTDEIKMLIQNCDNQTLSIAIMQAAFSFPKTVHLHAFREWFDFTTWTGKKTCPFTYDEQRSLQIKSQAPNEENFTVSSAAKRV